MKKFRDAIYTAQQKGINMGRPVKIELSCNGRLDLLAGYYIKQKRRMCLNEIQDIYKNIHTFFFKWQSLLEIASSKIKLYAIDWC